MFRCILVTKFILTIILVSSNSCISRNYYNTTIVQHDYWIAFQSARNSGDINLAINYIHLLANFSKDSIRCFDSASIIYYNAHFYPQSIYWSKKSSKYNDFNVFSLPILGRSYRRNSYFITSISYL